MAAPGSLPAHLHDHDQYQEFDVDVQLLKQVSGPAHARRQLSWCKMAKNPAEWQHMCTSNQAEDGQRKGSGRQHNFQADEAVAARI